MTKSELAEPISRSESNDRIALQSSGGDPGK